MDVTKLVKDRDSDDLARRYGGQKKQQTRVGTDSSRPIDDKCKGAGGHQSNKGVETASAVGGKKKTKYRALLTGDSKGTLIPGRHRCECQATKHKLIANCLCCGRVVCEQEGRGPCFFCSAKVPWDGTKPSEVERLERIGELLSGVDLKPLKARVDPVAEEQAAQGFIQAVQHKEKLLEYDRTSEQRTKVIDDEMDYFSIESNVWLTPEQRAELKKKEEELFRKKHASRLNKSVRVTIDFAGRQVIQPADEDDLDSQRLLLDSSVDGPLLGKTARRIGRDDVISGKILCPFAIGHEPKYEESDEAGADGGEEKKHGWLLEPYVTRIQDKELLEMADDGWCMSMHQPWAALLVNGVKRHEGRSWYSSHRGRLWIASTSKVVSQADVAELETFYRALYGDDVWEKRMTSKRPELFPSGCLLGCVDVVDVMSQEQYRSVFPHGESFSPFVFVCRNPRKLKIQIPVRGKHKIYQLERDIHEAAKKNLQEV